uniref:Uncharacterized protein n=1 Tax=uncultured marine virus TaxID=186617 RepID=A0A0F7L435_9VIRU|nr:hypothetical protein [uncultured marine virus]
MRHLTPYRHLTTGCLLHYLDCSRQLAGIQITPQQLLVNGTNTALPRIRLYRRIPAWAACGCYWV